MKLSIVISIYFLLALFYGTNPIDASGNQFKDMIKYFFNKTDKCKELKKIEKPLINEKLCNLIVFHGISKYLNMEDFLKMRECSRAFNYQMFHQNICDCSTMDLFLKTIFIPKFLTTLGAFESSDDWKNISDKGNILNLPETWFKKKSRKISLKCLFLKTSRFQNCKFNLYLDDKPFLSLFQTDDLKQFVDDYLHKLTQTWSTKKAPIFDLSDDYFAKYNIPVRYFHDISGHIFLLVVHNTVFRIDVGRNSEINQILPLYVLSPDAKIFKFKKNNFNIGILYKKQVFEVQHGDFEVVSYKRRDNITDETMLEKMNRGEEVDMECYPEDFEFSYHRQATYENCGIRLLWRGTFYEDKDYVNQLKN